MDKKSFRITKVSLRPHVVRFFGVGRRAEAGTPRREKLLIVLPLPPSSPRKGHTRGLKFFRPGKVGNYKNAWNWKRLTPVFFDRLRYIHTFYILDVDTCRITFEKHSPFSLSLFSSFFKQKVVWDFQSSRLTAVTVLWSRFTTIFIPLSAKRGFRRAV